MHTLQYTVLLGYPDNSAVNSKLEPLADGCLQILRFVFSAFPVFASVAATPNQKIMNIL